MDFRILLAATLAAAAGCAHLPPRPDLPVMASFAPAAEGALAERIAPSEAAHAGQSGFRLVSDGTEAFVVRLQSARLATRSDGAVNVEVQLSGRHRLLATVTQEAARELGLAADRTVFALLKSVAIDAPAGTRLLELS